MKKMIQDRKIRRKRRVSLNVHGDAKRPRIAVFRSNQHIYAQAIDDVEHKTITMFSSLQLKKEGTKLKKSEEAKQIGLKLAQLLIEKKVHEGILDRGPYAYLGRVKIFTEGLREGKLKI